jgi:hypothetical protein
MMGGEDVLVGDGVTSRRRGVTALWQLWALGWAWHRTVLEQQALLLPALPKWPSFPSNLLCRCWRC